MEATEIADKIHEEPEEDAGGGQPRAAPAHETFRKLAAIYLGVVAMLLAIASLGGGHATKEMLAANIHASDTYAYYQAKYIRQVHYQVTAEQLELEARTPGLPDDARAHAVEVAKRYRDTAARYDSEPQTGDGKKELLAKAKSWEERRDHAAAQDANFEYGEALFQIAIVLGSVSIVAASPALLALSGILAAIATVFTANGYFLVMPLPFT